MKHSAASDIAAFSGSYAQARQKLLDAAAQAGLPVQSLRHPWPGRDGEVLALDIVREDPEPISSAGDKVLILSSACHGVEGFCGSGVQIAALRDADWRADARAQGVTVLYLHALNPYGFSYLRRVTHENVDLNRNFQDFSKPLPVNTAYRELALLLLPEVWPPDATNAAATARYLSERGMAAFQAAISQGQHEFAQGLFFGGSEPSWSNLSLRQVLREHVSRAQRLAWIDLHTGLGPSGVGERIFACRDDAAALARARRWWGNGITSIYDGSSTSAFLTGLMWLAVYQECPQTEYTGIALEYGTQPIEQVLHALRADHWLHLHPQANAALAAQIRQQMWQAFYTDSEAWQQQVLAQAIEAMQQATAGLNS